MLKESQVFQRKDELVRRWFADDFFDLIVWFTDALEIAGFQLCYDKGRHERSLLWMHDRGYRHDAVDDGEATPTKNLTPILVPDGFFAEDVATEFDSRSSELDTVIKKFVSHKITEYLDNTCTMKK